VKTAASRVNYGRIKTELVGRTGFEPVTNGLKAGLDLKTPQHHNAQQQSKQRSNILLMLSIEANCRHFSAPTVPNLCHGMSQYLLGFAVRNPRDKRPPWMENTPLSA